MGVVRLMRLDCTDMADTTTQLFGLSISSNAPPSFLSRMSLANVTFVVGRTFHRPIGVEDSPSRHPTGDDAAGLEQYTEP